MNYLKNMLRRVIGIIPGGQRLSRYLMHRRLEKMGDMASIFQHYFKANSWGSSESLSGEGSTIAYTENIRKELPVLVEQFNVRSILDAPCGDYNWFGLIQWRSPMTYIGGDIVKPLIDRNISLFEGPATTFKTVNICVDVLPSADLWLCRDCLFHLSNRDIVLAIKNFLKSDIRYLLTTTHTTCTANKDIPTGSFRSLNLQLPPFSFCEPIAQIADWIEGFPVRYLALWDRETLEKCLANNEMFLSSHQSSESAHL